MAARAAGHHVVIATGAGLTTGLGLETWPIGAANAPFSRGGTAAERAAFFASSAARRTEDLLPRAEAWRPDLIVSDTAEVAGAVAAAATGARHVVHGLGIMPPMVLWNAYALHLDGLLARWGLLSTSVDAARDVTYLDVCPPTLRRQGERIWTNTLDLRPTTVSRGTAPPMRALPHRNTVLARPQSPADAAAILSALRNQPINLLLEADPSSFGPQPANVLIATNFPDAEVLPHCAALISSGGPGVLLPALGHGLPQLILSTEPTAPPEGEITHAGAALTAATPVPAAAEQAVRTHLPRLVEDPDFASAAAWIQVEIAAMSSPEAIVRALTTEGVPALR
ncbi:glycosyltransferase [Dactylosporangium sp. NPDC051541]|uniref:glycosyltransferase n=1 Tax=Dactylosporangium sp. NPDC051541 TaxID=3363977 RepID=UPI0037879BD3